METKKSERASAENKRFLFAEMGLAVALTVVLALFSYATPDKKATLLAEIATAIEEDDVPVILDTPPAPPQAPAMPVISDDIQIVDDDIQVDEFVSTFEEDATPVNIMDYVEDTKEEDPIEEDIIFVLVEEKPSFNGGDANEGLSRGSERERRTRKSHPSIYGNEGWFRRKSESSAGRRPGPGPRGRPRGEQLSQMDARQTKRPGCERYVHLPGHLSA